MRRERSGGTAGEAAAAGRIPSGGSPGGGPGANPAPLLELRDLRTWFETEEGVARAVDGVSLRLEPGETLGLVGESGCGKSVTALSILRLVPEPPGRILPGSRIRLRGEELLSATPERMRRIRGGEIAMIFQEPMTSLNPLFPVGDQVAEAIEWHRNVERDEARREAVHLLDRVGIRDPGDRFHSHPHQLSGGMRQRVMIAMALGSRPSVLIADEPTTALDVTVQAEILALLRSLKEELEMAMLLITHDLGVVAQVADRVSVMYAGQVVEEAPATELFRAPRHPYTRGLLAAVPDPDRPRERLAAISGSVPHPTRWPDGCRFRPRCPHSWDRCATHPPLLEDGPSRARCWLAEEPERRKEVEP